MLVELYHNGCMWTDIGLGYAITRKAIDDALYSGFQADAFQVAAPHIWIPKVGIVGALGLAASAAIIKNPEVTRRFWSGWRL